MAKVVLGLAVPHSPHVSTKPEEWDLHVDRDRKNPGIDFAGLSANPRPGIEKELDPKVYQEKYDRCNDAIDKEAAVLAAAAPDIVIVVGDDQKEMFLDDGIPAFAIFRGEQIVDIPEDEDKVHPSIRAAFWARHREGGENYPVDAGLATHLIREFNEAGFDITQMLKQPEGRGVGHAFSFIRLRLMRERLVPMIPIFVNCFFPPNQPTPARCYAFGKQLRRAIDSWPSDKRVAIVASGGLSHFVVDEELDHEVLRGLTDKVHREEILTGLPVEKLVSGTSEIRNWIITAAALEDFDANVVDYTASYRSLAGTGCGMGFVTWERALVGAGA